jgi:hypothetical protein
MVTSSNINLAANETTAYLPISGTGSSILSFAIDGHSASGYQPNGFAVIEYPDPTRGPTAQIVQIGGGWQPTLVQIVNFH